MRKIGFMVLLVLLAATIYGIVHTGASSPASGKQVADSSQQVQLDQTPLLIAQKLAQMPTTAQELPFAQDALRIADQEMDLAFAAAILDATEHPPTLSAEAKQIQARLQKAEEALAAQQAAVAQLTSDEAKATGSRKDALDDQIEQAKAQLELEQDEVDDAKQDLIRAGGDPQGRIQTLVAEHEAASQSSDTTKIAVGSPTEGHGLINRFVQWSALHAKRMQLWHAQQDAASLAAAFAAKHDIQEKKLDAQNQAAGAPVSGTGTANADAQASAAQNPSALLKSTKRRATDRKELSTLDKRIDNEKQLAIVYGGWIEAVAAEQRTVVNFALRGLLIILTIAILGLFVDRWLEALLGRMSMDRRQVETLRTFTRVTLQVVAVLMILLVIFGPPSQLGTFLGLAGAGLTVALKDFIISFFGWFVLMGKNGIRLGDWVEINGVTGEVVQLGMFHTVLLETGNWTDSGHPTGRRVTFTNSFAIEEHYFNFSTSGQWLWDELQIVLPAGQNPYPVVDAIQKTVVEATAESARQAQQEWRSTARSRDLTSLSAEPAINVKPVIGGTQISVRYITRAHERSQLRAKLNHAAVDLLGHAVGRQPTIGQTELSEMGPSSER